VAEDEMLVAMLLEEILADAGYRVLMAARLAKGLDMAKTQAIDAAILDINLAGQDSFPLADLLQRRHVPFVFASGYGSLGLPVAYQDIDILQKPYTMGEILGTIQEMLQTRH
jgi:DNA-binding response OmpR family regulator